MNKVFWQNEVQKWITEVQLTRRERDDVRLVVATLRDILLPDATDRSDAALVERARELARKETKGVRRD